MPFKSRAQMKWMFSNHPEMAKKWAKDTPNVMHLPNKKKSDKQRSKLSDAADSFIKGR